MMRFMKENEHGTLVNINADIAVREGNNLFSSRLVILFVSLCTCYLTVHIRSK